MLEDKIKKILVGAAIVGSLVGISGCGPKTEKCALPISSENYVGINYCPNYWSYGTESWADGCNNDQECICEKLLGELDNKCKCDCKDKPKPYEPHEHWK